MVTLLNQALDNVLHLGREEEEEEEPQPRTHPLQRLPTDHGYRKQS